MPFILPRANPEIPNFPEKYSCLLNHTEIARSDHDKKNFSII